MEIPPALDPASVDRTETDRDGDLTEALQNYFGFASFRAEQQEVVRRAVNGRDTLALMPTGAGKSLCYQLAAMLRPTPTVVISPLIALMKDQIDNLPPRVGPHATLINSSLEPSEAARRLDGVAAGHYKLVYAAPERLRQRQFVTALRSLGVGLVVIDEVHCVSMWGHDFRPDYLFIRSALETLGHPTVLGLTATATPTTARDIATALGRDLDVVRTSVVRSNLRYEVRHVENEEDRLRATIAAATKRAGSGIIYARSREKCERLAALLLRNGVRALHYHAGLDGPERSSVQEKFQRGSARVIVATTAFGMGIDKPDIRWVLLYNFPNSLESYVQMVGRAGRDGDESLCLLLAGSSDASNLRRFARADTPSIEQLRNVYRQVRGSAVDGWAEVTPEALALQSELSEDVDPRVLIGMLERCGLLRRGFDAGRAIRVELLPPPEDSSRRIESLLAQYEKQSLDRAGRMISFSESSRCRHAQVAEHFGESIETPCGRCDICSPDAETATDTTAQVRPLPSDIAQAIVDAIDSLSWPLGQTGLASALKGSIDAPPSSQRSAGYGVLAAAPAATIKRWIAQLIEERNIEPYENDGYKLLRVARRDDLPKIAPPGLSAGKRSPSLRDRKEEPVELDPDDEELFDALRRWRTAKARENGLPPYVVMHDRTLRSIAGAHPTSDRELQRIDGMGPSKTARYGEEIIAVVHGNRLDSAG